MTPHLCAIFKSKIAHKKVRSKTFFKKVQILFIIISRLSLPAQTLYMHVRLEYAYVLSGALVIGIFLELVDSKYCSKTHDSRLVLALKSGVGLILPGL